MPTTSHHFRRTAPAEDTVPDHGHISGRRLNTAVELVIPVHNEEGDLAPSVVRLNDYLTSQLPYSFLITIADNASTDYTWTIAQQLAQNSRTYGACILIKKAAVGP